jgi:hypothetical protein
MDTKQGQEVCALRHEAYLRSIVSTLRQIGTSDSLWIAVIIELLIKNYDHCGPQSKEPQEQYGHVYPH